ncbi:MAG: PTS sugar transporter subunit IIA [Verrucomicrobiota bacterium]|nr:PTS sugar transporter subunit IIA [Verrucomicrobiota bacterium]
MAPQFHELFDPGQVVLDLAARTETEAILEIVEALRNNGRVAQYYEFANAVMEREGRSSTNTNDGVAFPHARTDLVPEIVVGIGRSKAGVRFGQSKSPVHLIFLVGVPQRMVTDYLVTVGTIARIMRPPESRSALMAAETADAFVQLLRDGALLLE